VNFWGSQWAKNNTLSGGAAPSQFKGWIPSASSPATCGTASTPVYTSGPGNSASPPTSVPAYLAVVVSAQVANKGSVINGDIQKIVVVKTNSGYGPDPGHPGAGTIVGTICGN